jgi:hypothetical protein
VFVVTIAIISTSENKERQGDEVMFAHTDVICEKANGGVE